MIGSSVNPLARQLNQLLRCASLSTKDGNEVVTAVDFAPLGQPLAGEFSSDTLRWSSPLEKSCTTPVFVAGGSCDLQGHTMSAV